MASALLDTVDPGLPLTGRGALRRSWAVLVTGGLIRGAKEGEPKKGSRAQAAGPGHRVALTICWVDGCVRWTTVPSKPPPQHSQPYSTCPPPPASAPCPSLAAIVLAPHGFGKPVLAEEHLSWG